jgi:tRNA G18 (ribose-2'-O)-methylase SpoU
MNSVLDIGELVEEALSNIKQRRFLFIRLDDSQSKTEILTRRRQQVIDYLQADETPKEKSEDLGKQAFVLYLCGIEDAIEALKEKDSEKKQKLFLSAEKKLESARFTAQK